MRISASARAARAPGPRSCRDHLRSAVRDWLPAAAARRLRAWTETGACILALAVRYDRNDYSVPTADGHRPLCARLRRRGRHRLRRRIAARHDALLARGLILDPLHISCSSNDRARSTSRISARRLGPPARRDAAPLAEAVWPRRKREYSVLRLLETFKLEDVPRRFAWRSCRCIGFDAVKHWSCPDRRRPP